MICMWYVNAMRGKKAERKLWWNGNEEDITGIKCAHGYGGILVGDSGPSFSRGGPILLEQRE